MIRNYFLFVIICLPLVCVAQTKSVHSYVYFAETKSPMQNAVVRLVKAADSTLIAFTRTNAQGLFHFTNLDTTRFILSISYPDAAEYSDTLRFGKNSFTKQDTFFMLSRIQAIREIIIKKYNHGIRVNGDTTEYLADFFKTNPGATAEDLLRKLPGIQINKNGEITAQGEKIKQILVDGEEFFTDDPTIATKYLKAEMIDKVQVYNQKGDSLATVSPESVKTLNLTLKDGKKKGYFGKLEAGSNFDNYHNGGAFAGFFRPKKRGAFFAKTSTFENGSLNWQDNKQFGGTTGGSYSYNQEQGYYQSNPSFGDEMDNRGIPFSTSIGSTFSGKFDSAGKYKFNISYRFANEGVNGKILSKNKYFFPDTAYNAFDTSLNKSIQNGHRMNAKITLAIDSFNSLDLNVALGYNTGVSESKTYSKTTTNSENPVNGSTRELENSFEKINLTTNANYRHNFRKAGRVFYANASYSLTPSNLKNSNNSYNTFYNSSGGILQNIGINQERKNITSINNANLGLGFGDKLSKYNSYYLSINTNVNLQTNNTETNNKDNKALIDSLSNNFNLNIFKNTAGITLRRNRKKLSMHISLSGGITTFQQSNLTLDSQINYNFINLFPSMGITYTWKKQQNVSIYYNGSTNPPSISNLQPIVNNLNTLNQIVGNPDLRQSFNHNVNVYLNSYKTVKGRYMHGYLTVNLPRKAFATEIDIDSLGVRRTKTVNTNGNYNLNQNFDYSIKLKKLPLYISFEENFNASRNFSFSNKQKIQTDNYSAEGGLSVDIDLDFIYLELGYNITYNVAQNKSKVISKTSYIVQNPKYELMIGLPKNFKIESSGEFNIRPASAVFSSNRDVFYIVGKLSKSFGKNNAVECEFIVNDILNQNVGFSRDISTNLVSEQLYTQLGRAWLLSLKWNLGNSASNK